MVDLFAPLLDSKTMEARLSAAGYIYVERRGPTTTYKHPTATPAVYVEVSVAHMFPPTVSGDARYAAEAAALLGLSPVVPEGMVMVPRAEVQNWVNAREAFSVEHHWTFHYQQQYDDASKALDAACRATLSATPQGEPERLPPLPPRRKLSDGCDIGPEVIAHVLLGKPLPEQGENTTNPPVPLLDEAALDRLAEVFWNDSPAFKTCRWPEVHPETKAILRKRVLEIATGKAPLSSEEVKA